ncbi:helix-turn-helix domain-containing protein [Enterococcus dongliensis]|uniref:helix-turn-helix domain-containing protein n=1 Tax=Enterococcus dongliensis TaxID=2559925 RepID=UPI00288CC428|nr:helix-turn-helix transcriptional regulator [Enterococcus dongliensis]MDT2613128.1 helix-turn-helix transcriptional regulator [Enterococcus dongliensis]
MTLFERISILAKKHDKSLKEVAEDLGLSRNAIYQWKTSSPKADTLQKVATYFKVSTDFLLGKTDNPSTKGDLLDEEETDLLAAFRLESEDMTDEEKKKFNNSLKGMMKIAKGLLNDDSKWKE